MKMQHAVLRLRRMATHIGVEEQQEQAAKEDARQCWNGCGIRYQYMAADIDNKDV